MLAKIGLLSLIISRCVIGTNNCTPDNKPITMKGYTYMVEIGEKIPIYLMCTDANPFHRMNVSIYVNGDLEISDDIFPPLVANKIYYLSPFTNEYSAKQIKIIANYLNKGLEDTYCKFTCYSPSFNTYYVKNNENKLPKDLSNRFDFEMEGSSYSVKKSYDEIYINGNNTFFTKDSRFFDFSKFEIYSTTNEIVLENCEFRLYKKMEYTDLLFKEDKYTSIDVAIKKVNEKKYQLQNEEKFYIDSLTGGIYEQKNNNCDEELLSFFFPLSLNKDEKIRFEIIFYDIGSNHCNYIFQGYIYTNKLDISNDFGGDINYYYKEINEPLEDVEYE